MKTTLLITALMLLSVGLSALNPSRTYKQKPDKFKMKYEEIKVKTTDGHLAAWYIPAKEKTTKLILISHNGEGNMGDYLRRVDGFRAMGFNVVTFDYRGYGESSDFKIDNDYYIYPHFQDDYQAMLKYCAAKTKDLTLYGWGIGGGLALGIGFHHEKPNKIIADTPFLSMEDLESRFSDWDKPMEVPSKGFASKFEPINNKEKKPANPDLRAMILIGSNDVLFAEKDMKQLLQKPYLMDISVVENPDRKDNFQVAQKVYLSQIKAFLDKR